MIRRAVIAFVAGVLLGSTLVYGATALRVVTYVFDPPTTGSQPARYIVQQKVNDGPWTVIDTVWTPRFDVYHSHRLTYSYRVAAQDTFDRQGPWSPESVPEGSPGPPGAPGCTIMRPYEESINQ